MSRFRGRLDLQLLDARGGRPETRGGRSLWSLERTLSYVTTAGDRIRVPKGFVTDLASIPRPFWNLLPPDGPWVEAAVVHDFLYATHGTGVTSDQVRWISRKRPYSRGESDAVLGEAMADLGVPLLPRLAIYAGVRLGGWIGWGR